MLFPAPAAYAAHNVRHDPRQHDRPVVAVIAGILDGKATLAATANKEAQALGVKAGVLVKAVAQITGGNGGGKPDFAMAGVRIETKIDEALTRSSTS